MENPVFGAAASRKLALVLGVAFYGYGAYEFVYPELGATTGRLGWLLGMLQNVFGIYGAAVMWFVLGSLVMLLVYQDNSK